MLIGFQIALAAELLLVVLHGLIPFTNRFLPLGGTEISQIGILFGTAMFFYKLAEIASTLHLG